MARFPLRQAKVLELAEALIAGLTDNPAVYPAPPISTADLQAVLTACREAFDEVVAARAAFEMALTAKNEVLAGLVEKMKKDLRYAENTVDFDDDKLKLLGWSGKRAARYLTTPGQVRSLEAVEQGEDRLLVRWKAPVAGGSVAAYKIQRRPKDAGQWSDIATALKTEAELTGQPRHTDLEYRVIAVNRAGESLPSNTIAVVL